MKSKRLCLLMLPTLLLFGGANKLNEKTKILETTKEVKRLSSEYVSNYNVKVTYDKMGIFKESGAQFPHIRGKLDYLFDGHFGTYITFEKTDESMAEGGYLQFEYDNAFALKDIYIRFRGDKLLGDTMYGMLQYKVDEESNWVDLRKINGTNSDAEVFVKLDKPVYAKYLRLYNMGTNHWIGIADFLVNQNGVNYDTNLSNRTTEYGYGLFEGSFNNLDDGDDTTYIWTNASPVVGDYIQMNFGEPTDIYDLRYKFDSGDRMKGDLMYSTDGTDFETFAQFDKIEEVIEFGTEPLKNVVAIRMIATEALEKWAKLFDFSANNNSLEASKSDNLPFVNNAVNNPNNFIDRDFNTYSWYDYKISAGEWLSVNYRKVKTIHNIAIFQGLVTTGVNRPSDTWTNYDLEYSLDGITYLPIEGARSLSAAELVFELETPIEAKYVRIVNNVDITPNGVIIREFALNYEKIDLPITYDLTYSFTGQEIVPNYSIPYSAEDLNVRISINNGNPIVKPGTYEMTISTDETNAFNAMNKTITFVVFDTYEHFLESWEAMINAVDGNICTYFNIQDDNTLIELIGVFYNYLREEDCAKVANHVWNEESTIEETIKYVENAMTLDVHKDTTDKDASPLLFIAQSQEISGIIIISIISLIALALYYTIEKRKNVRN